MNRNQAGFSPVDAATVQAWFADPAAVAHYARAAASLGLWRSEQVIMTRVFQTDQRLLDAGCGAGRIAFGLWRRGFRRLSGIDNCPPMVEEARRLAALLGAEVDFQTADVRSLPLAPGAFDGVIFGFNGLMQIPGRAQRRAALEELRRVVAVGGPIVFTTHDRDLAGEREFWRAEASRRAAQSEAEMAGEFGDRVIENPEGRIFMHLPDRGEVLDDLRTTGWRYVADALRSEIANESADVREFADECRFWIARNELPSTAV